MARQDTLNIYVDDTTKDKLAESYGNVIDAIQKASLSEQIKNKNYSGDPSTGSVEIDRFKNATLQDYGTARSGGKGNALKNTGKVVINVDTDKEIVEEVEQKDLDLYGLAGIADKRSSNFAQRISAYLDKEFFAKAETEGTTVDLSTVTGVVEKLEALIVSVETTQNDWVDGVDRDMLVLTLNPTTYSALRNYIDTVPNSITGLTENVFHGVKVFENIRQTKDAICMIDGAVAQLVKTSNFDFDKIPLSEAYGLAMFVHKGTKAVMPDLIKFAKVVSK